MKVGDIVRVKPGVTRDQIGRDGTHADYLELTSFEIGRLHPGGRFFRIKGEKLNWIKDIYLELIPEAVKHVAPAIPAAAAAAAPEAAIIAAAPAQAIKAGDRVKFLGRGGIDRFKGGWKRKYEQYVGQVFTVAKRFEDGVTFNHPFLNGEFFDLRSVLLTGDAPTMVPRLNAIEEVASLVGSKPFTGVCQFAQKTAKGKWIKHFSAPCHANLRLSVYIDGYENGDEKGITNVVYYIANQYAAMTDECKALYPQYADYVVNRSPWAKTFLPRSGYEIARSGVEANVEMPCSWIASGAVALREGTEFSGRLGVFAKVRQAGFSEHVAYLISFMVQLPKGVADGKLSRSSMGGGHMAMSGPMRMNRVIEFFKTGKFEDTEYGMEKYKDKADEYQIQKSIDKDAPQYGGHGGASSLTDWSEKNLVGKKEGTGWSGTTVLSWEEVFKAALALEHAFKEAK